jgi:superfamily I DNA and/or RNA helicase
MHPAIAKIVSDCFYEGSLQTNPRTAEEFRTRQPPVRSIEPNSLPETPIVFIDMPYSRERHGYKGGDSPPAWSNADEVEAVVRALTLLRPRDAARPSLAVLSPYQQQVKALRNRINSHATGALAHLGAFSRAVGGDEFCGTVDSFQGDQADLVIVSLVRNNWHTIPAKALGFLRDDRRMNVLLSRARWRLIVVGSLRFFENVIVLSKSLTDADIGFLERFMNALEAAKQAGDASVVDWSTLPGPRR